MGDSVETQDSNLTLARYRDSVAPDEPPDYNQSAGGAGGGGNSRTSTLPLRQSTLPPPSLIVPGLGDPGGINEGGENIPAESIDEVLIDFGGNPNDVDLVRISSPMSRSLSSLTAAGVEPGAPRARPPMRLPLARGETVESLSPGVASPSPESPGEAAGGVDYDHGSPPLPPPPPSDDDSPPDDIRTSRV